MSRTCGWMLLGAILALGGCGGGGSNTGAIQGGGSDSNSPPPPPVTNQRGTLVGTPSLADSRSASQLTSELDSNTYGQQVLTLAGGTMACGVDIYHVVYWTVAPATSGTGTPIEDSAALMVPTGSAAQCTGARPIVLDGHGSMADTAFNSANLDDDPIATMAPVTQSLILAAIYASQGYIVVEPNYAGFDVSTLKYHPYFNAEQNSKDMIDALAAVESALSGGLSSVTYDGKLFVSGYSEGGFVGMATDKALQAAGETVVATALMSGVYAMEAHYDLVFTGRAYTGVPILVTSYQNAYGNVYQSQSDIYTEQYIASPGSVGAEFNGNPLLTGNAAVDALLQPPTSLPYDINFGNPYRITDSYRLSYVEDVAAHPDGAVSPQLPGAPLASAPGNALRQDLQLNDLRSWTPQMPMLLCGGHQDQNAVYEVNTQAMATYWSAQVASHLVTVLDVDSTPSAGDPYGAIETAFQQQLAQNEAAMGVTAALSVYHATVIPYCEAAARQFFGQF
ncbi:MAG TPA: hypothetical protein VFA39_09860 [Steroidobacteraceae bacterium]|nr:hypothetical protein [Steroidobacteraceae bacterium]